MIKTKQLEAYKQPIIELVKHGTPHEQLLSQMMVRTVAGLESVMIREEDTLAFFKEIWDLAKQEDSQWEDFKKQLQDG